MAGSVNKVILVGNLGRDPEVRYSQAGNKIVNMSIATSEGWKDKNTGEWRDKTEWHRIVIFDERIADVAEKYLKKGSKVYVEGTLQTRKWTDKSGAEKYSTEVVLPKYKAVLVMLDTRESGQSQTASAPREEPKKEKKSGGGGTAQPPETDLDDEIPFVVPWDITHGKSVL